VIELEQVNTPEGRYYRDSAGERYESVTTILHETFVPTPGLRRWMSNATVEQKEDAEKKKIAGGIRGTALHGMVENFFDHGVEGVGPYWRSIRNFLNVIEHVHLKEFRVAHRTLKYAGTLDMLADIDGEPTLIDWKTADKFKLPQYMDDYYQQVSAYIAALRHEDGDVIEQALVVVARPDTWPQIVRLDGQRLRESFVEFEKRVLKFQKAQKKRRSVA